MTKYFQVLVLVIAGSFVSAQQGVSFSNFPNVHRDFSNKVWMIELNDKQNVGLEQVPSFLSGILNSNEITLREKAVERDAFGFTHIRYEILRNGYPLATRSIVAHVQNGKLTTVNGDLEPSTLIANSFVLSETEALNRALQKVNAEKYKWQNEAETQFMRQILNDPAFSYTPKGEKVWFEKEGRLYAAWKFNIYAETPLYRANVYVDAENGSVLDEHNQLCTADVPGTAATKYSGTQTITCDQFGASHRLRQVSMGNGIETYNMQNGTNYFNAVDFTSPTANWNLNTTDQGALDAHWGAERTYDYYLTQHGRNSIDNAGKKLVSFVHYSSNYSNAFWDGQRMTYGDGNGSWMRIFTALDVCGHEITHGLVEHTSNLVYSYQSGALNESFADMFGTAIESFSRPSNWNWLIGEDITSNGSGLRSMSNPNSHGDPDTYLGTNWHSGSSDNGGVHINSGVPNFWFYLLVTGGSGVNDHNNAYNIQSIGMTKATQIAYRALSIYLTPNSDFAAARLATIQAAKDLFGDCSMEMLQVANAWYAVGVGSQVSAAAVNPNFISNVNSFCSVPATVTFSNTTPYAQSYVWSFGDGGTSTAMNPVHTYNTPGTYAVKLLASACNNTDSIIKSALIVIDIPQPPTVSSAMACEGTSAIFYASGDGEIDWYDSPTSTVSLYTGTMFTSPTITSNTTFYAVNSYTANQILGGIMTAGGGGYLNNTSHYLTFHVIQKSILNSVNMYAQVGGVRTVELRNANNVVIDSRTVQLNPNVINTVTLNFNLNAGTDYILGVAGGAGALYRSNAGVKYPYNIGQYVTITGSSNGPNSYYWFYQWRITRAPCPSAPSPASAVVLPLPQVNLAVYSEYNCVEDYVELTGSPAGGTLTGAGVVGNSFYAEPFGVGSYTVAYTYEDANGCQNSVTRELYAHECLGIGEEGKQPFSVFPNPSTGIVHFRGVNSGSKVTVTDNLGRTVFSGTVHDGTSLDLSSYARGLYIVNLYSSQNEQVGQYRIVKE